MHGIVDLEREPQPRAQEAILLGDVGRSSHQGDVGPHRDDGRLDVAIRTLRRRVPGTHDQTLEAWDVPRGAGEPAAHIDQGLRVDVRRESTEDDAQDHRVPLYRANPVRLPAGRLHNGRA